jgi:hypothetical protein
LPGVRRYGILNWIGVDCGLWKAVNGALKTRAHPTIPCVMLMGQALVSMMSRKQQISAME